MIAFILLAVYRTPTPTPTPPAADRGFRSTMASASLLSPISIDENDRALDALNCCFSTAYNVSATVNSLVVIVPTACLLYPPHHPPPQVTTPKNNSIISTLSSICEKVRLTIGSL